MSKISRYIREDALTKIIATHIRNINETFIGIFMNKFKMNKFYHYDRRYRMHTISVSVDWYLTGCATTSYFVR